MKFAIISDIHSNLEALETCLGYIDGKNVDKIICLGDIVGYGADPGLCVDLIKSRTGISVVGNHDAAIVGTTDIAYFNYLAREAIRWTRAQLTDEQVQFLESLPYDASDEKLHFVHATPASPERWYYIASWQDARLYFPDFHEKICFVGHSHYPGIYGESGISESFTPETFLLEKDEKYIINVGSVGQPRDGDPRLAFALYDSEEHSIELIRLEYDVHAASSKIKLQHLPDFLAERLHKGR